MDIELLFYATIMLVFLYSFARLWKEAFQYSSNLRWLQETSKQIAESKGCYLDDLDEKEQVWAKKHLILEHHTNRPFVSFNGGLALSKYPVEYLVPTTSQAALKSAPALLTTIGILGTFTGIALGLSNLAIDSTNAAALVSQAGDLLAGMKTAFFTSIVGMGSSGLFMVCLYFSNRVGSSRYHQSVSLLNKYVLEVHPTELLKQHADAVSTKVDLSESIQSLSDALKRLQTNQAPIQIEQLATTLAEVVTQPLSTSLAENSEAEKNNGKKLEAISKQLELVNTNHEIEYKNIITTLVDTLEEKIAVPMSREISNSSATVKRLSEAVYNNNVVIENFVQVSTDVSQSMNLTASEIARASANIENFEQGTLEKLESFASSLNGSLERFSTQSNDVLNSITDKVSDVLQHGARSMEAQRVAFQESSDDIVNSFAQLQQGIDAGLEKRLVREKEVLSSMEARLQSWVDGTQEAFNLQNSTLVNTGKQAAELMKKASEDLASGLGDIDSRVSTMSETVQRELERFRVNYQDSLNCFFEQQNSALESTLGQQRNNLMEVVDRFKDTFEQEYKMRNNLLGELTGQYEHLMTSAERIERLAKAVGLHEASKLSELQDAASTMGRQVAHLKKEYAASSEKFSMMVEAMPKAMDSYFIRANQSIEGFFKDFDKASGRIHSQLANAADLLVTARLEEKELQEQEYQQELVK
ncbi:MAG: hypothetical protein V7739_20785 [Motiliproteus sp.]